MIVRKTSFFNFFLIFITSFLTFLLFDNSISINAICHGLGDGGEIVIQYDIYNKAQCTDSGYIWIEDYPYEPTSNQAPTGTFSTDYSEDKNESYTITITLTDDGAIDKTYCYYAWANEEPTEFSKTCNISELNTVTISGDLTDPGEGVYTLYLKIRDSQANYATISSDQIGFNFGVEEESSFYISNTLLIIMGSVVAITPYFIYFFITNRRKKEKIRKPFI